MRILFIALLLLAATVATAQTHSDTLMLRKILANCEKSAARYRTQSGKSCPVYLTADKQTTFYVDGYDRDRQRWNVVPLD